MAEDIGKTRPFESPEQEACLNIMRTNDLLYRQLDRLLKHYGLSNALYNVLRIVAGHAEAGVPSQTIGRQLISFDPDVTRLVDRLVQAGLVRRERSQTDRRVVRVTLTATGRAKLDQVDPLVQRLHVRQLGHMSEAELSELVRLLTLARAGGEAVNE